MELFLAPIGWLPGQLSVPAGVMLDKSPYHVCLDSLSLGATLRPPLVLVSKSLAGVTRKGNIIISSYSRDHFKVNGLFQNYSSFQEYFLKFQLSKGPFSMIKITGSLLAASNHSPCHSK